MDIDATSERATSANDFADVHRLRTSETSVRAESRTSRVARLAPILGVVGAIVCIAAVGVSAAGSPADAAFGRGLLEFLIVGLPIAGGVYALRTPGNAGFGIPMLAIGFFWSLTALGQTSASVPYTFGRLAIWCVYPGVVYLLLAFPDGRIAKGVDRVLFFGIVGVLVILYFGTAPLVEAYPLKTFWATCTTDCPANALFVLDHQPAFLPNLILFREWLIELLWLGLFCSMYRRWRTASPLQQRAMGPVFVAGALLGLFHIAHITYRQLGGATDTVIALSSAWTVSIVLVCVALLVGLIRRRALLAGALARLGADLREGATPQQVRAALARALSDPSIELLARDSADGTWRDADGGAVPAPRLAPCQEITTIGVDDHGHEVALVHDVALRDDRELLDGVSDIMQAAWRYERLRADHASAMSDLKSSRRRIAEAADLARARIERDLHDGAQQRLIALRIRMGLAEELVQSDPAAGVQAVRELGFEVEGALEELRSLAQGVFPSLLIDRGLPDALASLARQSSTPVHLAIEGHVTRHPVQIESVVYFACAEAIQNAMKHADGATGIWVTLTESPHGLHFEVRDDGAGFVPTDGSGQGLRNMRDRIEGGGGQLTLDAAPGRGTRVTGAIPL